MFGGDIGGRRESGYMPAEERRGLVLKFLVDAGLALPRKVIYRNLAYRGATFSESSVKNYLAQLRDAGLIERVDAKELENGELVPSDDQAGYYVPTEAGKREVQNMDLDRDPVLG